ncbi:MAG: Smr/MutS family protein [Variibacter sp.]
MTDDEGRKRHRARRALSGEERDLWRVVTRSIAPLRGRAKRPPCADPEDDAPLAPPKPKAKTNAPHPSSAPRTAVAKPTPPPLAPLDGRLKKRVARGGAPLDARLDLHGMTQAQAHLALLRFIRAAQADGAKLVLVITGKGVRGASAHHDDRGVLRRLVPQWLRLAEFRTYVVGFEHAHIAHGGEGALYVRLRRAR